MTSKFEVLQARNQKPYISISWEYLQRLEFTERQNSHNRHDAIPFFPAFAFARQSHQWTQSAL